MNTIVNSRRTARVDRLQLSTEDATTQKVEWNYIIRAWYFALDKKHRHDSSLVDWCWQPQVCTCCADLLRYSSASSGRWKTTRPDVTPPYASRVAEAMPSSDCANFASDATQQKFRAILTLQRAGCAFRWRTTRNAYASFVAVDERHSGST